MTNMKPIQVYLRTEQIAALRALASRRGVSIAELVRSGVDQVLSEGSPEDDPAWNLVGLFDSGVGDLAEKHNAHIADAILRECTG